MVYRLHLTYDEILDIFVVKCDSGSTIGYTLVQSLYEIADIILMVKSLFPNYVKVKIINDDIRLKSSLTTNKTIRFTKKSFVYAILGFIGNHSRPLCDIDGFVQFIPGSYRSNKPIIFTGIGIFHLKCDCINGSIVNGIREPILYSLALDQPPGLKIHKELNKNFLKK